MFTRVSIAASVLTMLIGSACGEQPRPVRVQTVVFVPEQQTLTYPGTVQARVQANLGFRVNGKIIARMVNIGDHVKAGQRLARLDPADLRLTVESGLQAVRAANAEAVNARAEFNRYQRLGRNSPAWIASEFDRRQATLDSTEARLAQAQRQLSLAVSQLGYAELQADADGVITDLRMEPGQVVNAGQTVTTLAHTAEIEVVADIPENRLADIRNTRHVGIRLWSRPDIERTGRVREIGGLADPMSRTFAVRVSVLNPPDSGLDLGITALISFDRDASSSIALLPATAIVDANGTPAVWVLDPVGQRPVLHRVQVARWSGDGQAVITSGIADGDQVVTAGASQLDPATPITAWAGATR